RSEMSSQRLRELLRVGRTSLIIGSIFLATCLVIGDWVTRAFPDRNVAKIVSESLTIGGWVAMWRPLEIFLYSWWPILRERRLLERLSQMPVRIACVKGANMGASAAQVAG